MISSTKSRFNTSGTKPAPIPWILWGPFLPPLRTGEAAGSTAIALKLDLSGFYVLCYPSYCSACTDTGYQDVYFSVCIIPDFWPSGFFVNLGVCQVLELLGYERVRGFCKPILQLFLWHRPSLLDQELKLTLRP